MSHLNYTTKNRNGKHLNYEERIKIETLLDGVQVENTVPVL